MLAIFSIGPWELIIILALIFFGVSCLVLALLVVLAIKHVRGQNRPKDES